MIARTLRREGAGARAFTLGLGLVLVLVLATLPCGCASSTYERRDQRLLAMRMRTGVVTLERDQRQWSAAALTGDLASAVSGVPEAEAHAATAQRAMLGFLGSYLGGLVLLIGGPVTAMTVDQAGVNEELAIGSGVAVTTVGMALVGASIYFATRSQAASYDAVTAYNDAQIIALREALARAERAAAAARARTPPAAPAADVPPPAVPAPPESPPNTSPDGLGGDDAGP